MRIFLLRHGDAAGLGTESAQSDDERPLTDTGRTLLANACSRYAPHLGTVDKVIASPFLRARQSAEELAQATGFDGTVEGNELLTPGARPTALLDELQAEAWSEVGTVALVGHEPHLGNLLGLLLTGSEQVSIPLQKGMLVGVQVSEPQTMLGRLVLTLTQNA